MATDEDRLAFAERELYWLPSGNMRDSALKLKRVEALVGTWTMRTKGTIEQIAEKYFAD
jgi:tetraacyldisaccharide-1-P 4'-kinase